MENKFQSKKHIYSLNIDARLGSYALDETPLSFEHCRERFSSGFDENTNGIFFKTLPDRVESVARFIWHTENKGLAKHRVYRQDAIDESSR